MNNNIIVEIFTDGSSTPSKSGYGFLMRAVRNGEVLKEKEGSEEIPHTTNNRAEITAVIEGLRELKYRSSVTIYSDSQYVVKTMKKQWKRKTNHDLWEKLDIEVKKHNVKFRWIPRESNQIADGLSRAY